MDQKNFLLLVCLVAVTSAISPRLRREALKNSLRAYFNSEAELEEYLHNTYEKEASENCYVTQIAEWNYATDVDNSTAQAALVQATLQDANFTKEHWETYFKDLNPNDYQSETIRREVKQVVVLGNAALSDAKLENLTNILNNMTTIYSTGKVCPYKNQNCVLSTEGLSLEPDIESVLAESTDYYELEYVWAAWRNATGKKMRDYYKQYVELVNEAAQENNYTDRGALWRDRFESETFIEDMDELWEQLEPLYSELHTYVRNKLKERYGDKLDVSDGLVPAHVFGNMWAQSWVNLEELVKPYPEASEANVTAALIANNYTVLKMFEIADEFYQSLGLPSNAISYNESAGAMIQKPTDGREVLCHASAWDFCDGETFRIKMCTNIDYEDFVTIHHEMGHIQYYIQYKDQPYTLRGGANPGFHEAVGDTIALSVSNPYHMKTIGLLPDYVDSDEAAINALMDMALERVAFLPFGLLIDKWRWDVFSGNVSESEWNEHWWHYREKYQKVKAPVSRSEEDFDPGAKYHVAGDSQYISYFVAHVLEFQFYKALCIAAGEYNPETQEKPLHKCDFYNNTAAGDLLKKGLSLGESLHWNQTLYEMTGERNLNASALLEYFQPLYEYLQTENAKADNESGASSLQSSLFTITSISLILFVNKLARL